MSVFGTIAVLLRWQGMVAHARRATARHYFECLLVGALLAGACVGTQSELAPVKGFAAVSTELGASCPVELVTSADARALIDKYCVSCHSPTGSAGEDFDFRTDAAISARRRSIEAKLRLHAMPPPNARQPSDAERAMLRCWAKQ